MTRKSVLTKSKFITGIRCFKSLYLEVHHPELATPPDMSTLRRFVNGKKVNEIAYELYPEGVLIPEYSEQLSQAVITSKDLLKSGTKTLFEPAIRIDDLLCRIDILDRLEIDQNFSLIEVKSSTSFKPEEHIPDVGFQYYCMEKAGYPVTSAKLIHINKEYSGSIPVQTKDFFITNDITPEVRAFSGSVPEHIAELQAVLSGPSIPDREIGSHCKILFKCPFYEYCHKGTEYTTEEFRGPGSTSVKKRIGSAKPIRISDLPESFKASLSSKRYRNQIEANTTDKAVIDLAAIRNHLKQLQYPLYYFDMETVFCPIPLFPQVRPYQQIPTQYSLHRQDGPGAILEHIEFLMEDREDPRERLIESLRANLGTTGSIIAYNINFEKTRLKELADDFNAPDLLKLLPRFWDLMKIFKDGDYVDKDFHGSWSIKAVLPVLLPSDDLSYKSLDIQEGATASVITELWYAGELSEKKWKVVRKHLLKYCGLDTWAMVKINEYLQNLSEAKK